MDPIKPLWAMPLAEFLTQPFNRWAEVLIASGHHQAHAAKSWLQEWEGKYDTIDARDAARGAPYGRGWVFAVEWSNRTWRREISKALERGEKVPAEILREAGIAS